MEIVYTIDDFPNPGDQDVYLGIQELNKENYQEAQKYFEKGSNYHNEYASLFNSLLYYTGFGFEKRDPSKSMDMFKKIALEWNNPVAQYLIGAMYNEGDDGVSQHKEHAIKWLSLAADNNWVDAMVLLGLGYREGTLFEKDEQKACGWFQKVAQKDDKETEPIDDGIIYLFGNKKLELRLDQRELDSIEKSLKYLKYTPWHYLGFLHWLTMDKSYDPNCTNIWCILVNKKLREAIPSEEQIGYMYSSNRCRAFPKLTYFLKKNARNGSKEACMTLGSAYEWGDIGRPNSVEAVKWYKRTLELNGDINAAYRIGIIFHTGKGVKKDLKVALEYFKLAAHKGGFTFVYTLIGRIYEEGKDGVPQDYTLARQYFEKAFAIGDARGAIALTRFYSVRKDRKQAEEWMWKAIYLNHELHTTSDLDLFILSHGYSTDL